MPGPGMPGAAGHPRALCPVTGGGRVRAAGPSQQPARLGFSTGHPWGEEARLGSAPSVSGFCLASWLWARSPLQFPASLSSWSTRDRKTALPPVDWSGGSLLGESVGQKPSRVAKI